MSARVLSSDKLNEHLQNENNRERGEELFKVYCNKDKFLLLTYHNETNMYRIYREYSSHFDKIYENNDFKNVFNYMKPIVLFCEVIKGATIMKDEEKAMTIRVFDGIDYGLSPAGLIFNTYLGQGVTVIVTYNNACEEYRISYAEMGEKKIAHKAKEFHEIVHLFRTNIVDFYRSD